MAIIQGVPSACGPVHNTPTPVTHLLLQYFSFSILDVPTRRPRRTTRTASTAAATSAPRAPSATPAARRRPRPGGDRRRRRRRAEGAAASTGEEEGEGTVEESTAAEITQGVVERTRFCDLILGF